MFGFFCFGGKDDNKNIIVNKLQEELQELINEKEIIEEACYLDKEEIDENLIYATLIELTLDSSLRYKNSRLFIQNNDQLS